jgi:hypothetical protein
MKIHDKILLAGELLVDAAETYQFAKKDTDYAKSILISGAVIGIVAPWLDELNIKSSHLQPAEITSKIKGVNLAEMTEEAKRKELGKTINFYRLTYNLLKHAGNGKKVKASDDLTFKSDLKEEAYYLISSAIDDYKRLPLSQKIINTQLSDKLLSLLQSAWI